MGISIEQYLKPDFLVEKGKLRAERVQGGVILNEENYAFSMPPA